MVIPVWFSRRSFFSHRLNAFDQLENLNLYSPTTPTLTSVLDMISLTIRTEGN